eukprot:gene13582-551_t
MIVLPNPSFMCLKLCVRKRENVGKSSTRQTRIEEKQHAEHILQNYITEITYFYHGERDMFTGTRAAQEAKIKPIDCEKPADRGVRPRPPVQMTRSPGFQVTAMKPGPHWCERFSKTRAQTPLRSDMENNRAGRCNTTGRGDPQYLPLAQRLKYQCRRGEAAPETMITLV